ncbi:tetratricopeptide repeat protein [Alsobacter sp. SYSU M60028]|uniref:Tetratricopeptide repeat protein n=1 Tax=Alsobacter ponti TaxID=2962936 RepID=A0ABT1LE64_9HYPH|nr:tetratricopeptide repeat protein [Alsobacter ponti]MCP8939779.1 tetratricopeptide repeat protein [Alsobacter ponti]
MLARSALRLGLSAAALGATLDLAAAQAEAPPPSRARPPAAEKAAPVRPRPFTLDDLFARLQATKDPVEAKGIVGAIERRWLRSGSDTADLLMSRALEALQGGDQPLAIELLDRVVAFQPNWAEGWNKRATVFFMMGDTTRAMADLEQVLILEPRHFGALAGIGAILRNNGDDKRAFDAFRRALAVNPHMPDLKEAVDRMAPDVEGRDI